MDMTLDSPGVIPVPPPAPLAMPGGLLGVRWQPLADVPAHELEPLLRAFPHPLSGYTRAALTGWDAVFSYVLHRTAEGDLLISYRNPEDGLRHLLQPVGPLSDATARLILDGAAALGRPLRMVGVSSPFLEQHAEFVRHFEVQEDRASANYVYLASDLAELPGRKYFKKRNLLSQAEREYRFTEEPMTDALALACLEFVNAVNAEEGIVPEGTRAQEHAALTASLRAQARLQQRGLVIRVDGQLAAFSVWEEQSPDTAVVHFEKARRAHKGIYQVINQATAKAIAAAGYRFINREEDLGNEGLRQAKMTYFPVELRASHQLVFGRPPGA